MTIRTRFVSIVTMALVFTWSYCVNAGIVTINFPGDLADPCLVAFCNHNTTADGFRISPEFHYHGFVNIGGFAVPGIGWDMSPPTLRNPDYLGPPSDSSPPFRLVNGLYVDHDGLSFTLLSLERLGGDSLMAESSNGGIAFIPASGPPPFPNPLPPHVDFVGPEWGDIQWVTFWAGNLGAPTAGFNQLVTFVPGLPTLGLLGLGVLILGWRSRSSTRHPKR